MSDDGATFSWPPSPENSTTPTLQLDRNADQSLLHALIGIRERVELYPTTAVRLEMAMESVASRILGREMSVTYETRDGTP